MTPRFATDAEDDYRDRRTLRCAGIARKPAQAGRWSGSPETVTAQSAISARDLALELTIAMHQVFTSPHDIGVRHRANLSKNRPR